MNGFVTKTEMIMRKEKKMNDWCEKNDLRNYREENEDGELRR